MLSSRIARAALSRTSYMSSFNRSFRRGYAEVAGDRIRLTLSLPHQAIFKSNDVIQVNVPAESGAMGVLASHVPSIEQLTPGVVEVVDDQQSKSFFLSGGFATVQPNSELTINAVEGFPIEDFSIEAVRNQLAEVSKVVQGNGTDLEIAEAKIEMEVLESLQAALK